MGLIGLDPSKSVGEAFEIEGYPTLVILDGKGIVQSVHVGFDPEAAEPLNKTLAKEIDEILEGKSLATPRSRPEASRRTISQRLSASSRDRDRLPMCGAVSIDDPSARRRAPITASLRSTRCRGR